MNAFGAKQRQALGIAFVVTFAAHAVPFWVGDTFTVYQRLESWMGPWRYADLVYDAAYDVLALLFGLVLVLRSPRRYGLRIGKIRQHWREGLFVCGLPLVMEFVIASFVHFPTLTVSPRLI